MSWYLSPALVRLRTEINGLWPGRDRSSDGSIGDVAHSARRSDHNPDYQAGGIVRAIDVDEDGVPATSVVAQVIRDPRVAYVIYEGRIWENPQVWPGRGYWRAYSGPNPHAYHFHVSVRRGTRWDSDASSWGLMRSATNPVSNTGGSTGGSLPDLTLDELAPIDAKPVPLEDEDMILITAPDRPHALVGPSYYRALVGDEEIALAGALATKTLDLNARQWYTARDLALTGQTPVDSARAVAREVWNYRMDGGPTLQPGDATIPAETAGERLRQVRRSTQNLRARTIKVVETLAGLLTSPKDSAPQG